MKIETSRRASLYRLGIKSGGTVFVVAESLPIAVAFMDARLAAHADGDHVVSAKSLGDDVWVEPSAIVFQVED